MFFVAGITGQVGGAVARALLAQDKQVRALVRDPTKASEWAEAGVELRVGDLANTAALGDALNGVEGAFILVPPVMPPSPDFREARAVTDAYRQAIAVAAPPRVVALSSVGADQPDKLGMITANHLLEEAVASFAVPVAILRPGSFYENFAPALGHVAETGVFDSFMQPVDRRFPMAATADIGAEAARLLIGGWTGDRVVVELGDDASPDDIAAAMSAALDVPVTARAVPRDRWDAAIAAMGLPPAGAAPYAAMTDAINSGWIAWRGAGERVQGTTSPEHVYRQALGKTEQPGHTV